MYQFVQGLNGRKETLGAVLASSVGTAVTASATINTKGAWTTIGTTGFAYEAMTVFARTTTSSVTAFDIGIDDGSGNVWVLADNLLHSPGTLIISFILPLHVPSGSKLVARVQSPTASAVLQISITGDSQGLMGAPGFSRLVSLTPVTLSTGVSCPSGVANTKARTQIVASSSVDVSALIFGTTAGGGTYTAGAFVDLEIGAAAAEQVIAPNIQANSTSAAVVQQIAFVPYAVAAGARFSVNFQTVVGTVAGIFSLHGLV